MRYLCLIAACCVLSLVSCRNDQDGKSAIDRRNEKVAEEAVRAIRTPLEKAQNAADQENAYTEQLEKQLKPQ